MAYKRSRGSIPLRFNLIPSSGAFVEQVLLPTWRLGQNKKKKQKKKQKKQTKKENTIAKKARRKKHFSEKEQKSHIAFSEPVPIV